MVGICTQPNTHYLRMFRTYRKISQIRHLPITRSFSVLSHLPIFNRLHKFRICCSLGGLWKILNLLKLLYLPTRNFLNRLLGRLG